MEKRIIEKYCGEEITIIDKFIDKKRTQIVCTRESFSNKIFCYVIKKNKVVFTNSREV